VGKYSRFELLDSAGMQVRTWLKKQRNQLMRDAARMSAKKAKPNVFQKQSYAVASTYASQSGCLFVLLLCHFCRDCAYFFI
jgi:hypothetical protein